jgi:transcriptional regulator with XRE-family HTH domain
LDFFTNYNLLCKAAGKSANGVAKELGIASGSVTQWKQGSTPRPATVERIAKYFGVTPEELLFGIKKEPSIPTDEELDKNDAISNFRDNVLYHFPDATPQDVSALMNAIEGTDLTVQELIRIAEMLRRMSPADRKFVKGIFEAYTEAK